MRAFRNSSMTWGLVYGFGALISLYAIQSIYAARNLSTLADLTKTVYDHPLTVSNAALLANTTIIKMHRNMKDVVLFPNEDHLRTTIGKVDALEVEAIHLLEEVNRHILGDEGRQIASRALDLFHDWKPIRDRVIRLVGEGEIKEASLITKGEGADHVALLEQNMRQLTQYARNKATGFLRESEAVSAQATQRGLALAALWIVISCLVAWITIERARSIEKELADEKEKLSVTLKSIGDGVISTDTQGRVTLINPMAETLTGWTEAEAEGQDIKAVFNIVNEHSREPCQNPVETVLSTKRVVGLANNTLLIAKDGKESVIANSGAPIRTRSGDIVGTVLVFRDQSVEREYQAKLLNSEKKYRLLADNTLDTIWTTDLDHTFTYVNPAIVNLTGYGIDEWVGGSWADHCNPEEFGKITTMISAETAKGSGGEGVIFEIELQSKDEAPVAVEINSQVIFDGNERPVRIQGSARDITERKKAARKHKKLEQQLIQAQKMESVGRLAGGVAHDYNNMLSVIIGYTELALEKVGGNEKLRLDLNEVFKAANHSADITRQLLAFARQQTVAPKVIDLNEKIESLLKMLRRLIGEDIELAWRPGSHLWRVKIDPMQVDQITANLCVNARDAIVDVGNIIIETNTVTFDEAYCAEHLGFRPGEYVMLAVSDDGSGMDKDTLDKIFEPFFTTKNAGRGTGLGLATVFGIVKQNDGFINVYSEPGKGTTFRLYFCRYVGDGSDNQTSVYQQVPHGNGEVVLVVEDEVSILRLAERILLDLNYRVRIATTPAEALETAAASPEDIALLITDVVMPGMNGRELADRLKMKYPAMQCLYMSGYTADVIAHRGVLDEGVHFIPKPFTKYDLATKAREVLDE